MSQQTKAQVEERRREAKACKMIQVLHLGSPHLNVPNKAIGKATSGASTKATNQAPRLNSSQP